MQRLLAATLLALSLIAPAVHADAAGHVLTLDEAARLAIEHQPGLDAYDYAALSAREAAVAEGELPDPVVSIGAQNVPLSGDRRFRLNADDMTMATVGIMQEMVRPEKRRAGANRMRAASEQWELERAAEARRIVRDAKLAWTDAYETAKRAALYSRIANELAAERQVASRRLSTESVTASDVFQLDTMLSGMNDRRIATENASRRARAQLSRWLGDAAFRPLPDALSDLPLATAMTDRSAAEQSFDRHPELAVRRKAEEVARYEAQRARAERKSDWSWEVMYGHRQDDRADMVSFQIAVPLQIDRANRQDRRLAEKLALVDRAQSMALDQERQLRAEFLAVRADYEAALERLREHEDRLIPAALARVETARAGYAAGTLPLSAVWEARRGLLDAENEHVMIEAELLRVAIRHEYLTGAQQ